MTSTSPDSPIEVVVHLDATFSVPAGYPEGRLMSVVMTQLGILFERYRSSEEDGNYPFAVSVWGAHIELPSCTPSKPEPEKDPQQ